MNPNRLPISVVIPTKNEERNIVECIDSLKSFAEIIVVDSQSSDRTVDLATSTGSKVIYFNWDGKYPKKKQWILQNLSFQNEWVLYVDADERMTPRLESELTNFLIREGDLYSGASIPIEYYFMHKKLRFGQKPRKLALLKPQNSSFPQFEDLASEGMGELEGHYQPVISGNIKKFRFGLVHNDNDPISSWMLRHVKYAQWEAFLINNSKIKVQVDSSKSGGAFIFHKLPFRSVTFFVYSYLFKLGILDGRAGLDYAISKSWYYWLSGVISRENRK